MLIIGPRPTIGWVVYLIVGKSWFRMSVMLLLLGCATLTLLNQSKDSVSLQYTRPSHFPPPLIILPFPNQNILTPFDACAIESATSGVPVPRNYNFPKKPTPVYVYYWTANVPKNDIWLRTVKELPGVTLAYMDLSKVLKNTPLSGKFPPYYRPNIPDWITWIAAGGSLLWNSGGILIPSRVLLTTPLYLDMVEENTGLLVIGKSRIRHVAFGVKMHHNLTKTILEYTKSIEVNDYSETLEASDEEKFEPLDELLTQAVGENCEVTTLESIRESDTCAEFTKLDESQIWKFDFQTPVSKKKLENQSFLQFVGDSAIMLQNLRATNRLFRKHGLHKFCPRVHQKLEKELLEIL